MKHLRNSLVVFAGVLVVAGVITFFIPSRTKGMSNDVPKSAFSLRVIPLLEGTAIVSGPDPEGTSYAITSLTVTNLNELAAGSLVTMRVIRGDTTDCFAFQGSVSVTDGPFVIVPAGETVHLSFPQPFVFSTQPGAATCLRLEGTSHPITVVGYKF
jgi:hypothetical protein